MNVKLASVLFIFACLAIAIPQIIAVPASAPVRNGCCGCSQPSCSQPASVVVCDNGVCVVTTSVNSSCSGRCGVAR